MARAGIYLPREKPRASIWQLAVRHACDIMPLNFHDLFKF